MAEPPTKRQLRVEHVATTRRELMEYFDVVRIVREFSSIHWRVAVLLDGEEWDYDYWPTTRRWARYRKFPCRREHAQAGGMAVVIADAYGWHQEERDGE